MSLDLSTKVVCGVVLERKILKAPYSYGFYHPYDKVLHKESDLTIPKKVIDYAELHGLPLVTKVVLVV